MVGSCQQLLQDEERLGTELVGSLAPAGSKAAGVDLATAQEAIAAFPASVWEGGAEAPALPPMSDTMQGQLKGPAEALYFTDGETEGYRDVRGSLKFTQQVVARPELEYVLKSAPYSGALAAPPQALWLSPPGSGAIRTKVEVVRARYGMGPGEGREQASHCQTLGDRRRGGGESSCRPFPGFLVLPFLAV